MTELLASGSAHLLGDDINTDYIVPSHRKKETIDPDVLRKFMFEDIKPDFYSSLGENTILVAGSNFGCGSAMEVAVTVLLRAGIRAVVAKSFSRTYKRNAFNNGLLLCTADTASIKNDEHLQIILEGSDIMIHTGRDETIPCEPIPPFMIDMLRGGGLINYLGKHKGFVT